jgi:hypothetical protein
MDLARSIKSNRARQKSKRSHKRKVFTTVSLVVKEYKLGNDFLQSLDGVDRCLSQRRAEPRHVKGKRLLEVPPYSLVTQDEYGIVMAIISKLDNPYLRFAHSPEEMLLSVSLYEADPSLPSEDLLGEDFETLLLGRQAKDEQSGDLEKQLGLMR